MHVDPLLAYTSWGDYCEWRGGLAFTPPAELPEPQKDCHNNGAGDCLVQVLKQCGPLTISELHAYMEPMGFPKLSTVKNAVLNMRRMKRIDHAEGKRYASKGRAQNLWRAL